MGAYGRHPRVRVWGEQSIIPVDRKTHPSRWVNIVGRVEGLGDGDPPTMRVRHYDGIEEVVPLGPNGTRLVNRGDFNIEVPPEEASAAGRDVTLILEGTAPDVRWFRSGQTLLLVDRPRNDPLGDDWVVVDGDWVSVDGGESSSGGGESRADAGRSAGADEPAAVASQTPYTPGRRAVRNRDIGYDRLLAVGHRQLRYMCAEATITIHRFDTEHPDYPNMGPGVGLLLRWNGHTCETSNKERPRLQWRPIGGLCWYRFGRDLADTVRDYRLQILGGRLGHGTRSEPIAEDTSGAKLDLGVPYRFVAEVTGADDGAPGWYRFAVFDPRAGNRCVSSIEGRGLEGEQPQGSVLVVAHHAEITVEAIRVHELRPGDPPHR